MTISRLSFWVLQASSLNIAEKAGEIIRDVMQRGELNTVNKVFKRISSPPCNKKLLKPLQGENVQSFDPQTEADRWVIQILLCMKHW